MPKTTAKKMGQKAKSSGKKPLDEKLISEQIHRLFDMSTRLLISVGALQRLLIEREVLTRDEVSLAIEQHTTIAYGVMQEIQAKGKVTKGAKALAKLLREVQGPVQ
jgi:hypothetical protein